MAFWLQLADLRWATPATCSEMLLIDFKAFGSTKTGRTLRSGSSLLLFIWLKKEGHGFLQITSRVVTFCGFKCCVYTLRHL